MSLKDWIHEKIFGSYPTDIAPTVRLGYVGTTVRYESTKDRDYLLPGSKWFVNRTPFEGKVFNSVTGVLDNAGFEFVSHQQKVSRWGFLIQKPFCLFYWNLKDFQKKDAQGIWIPGTELGRIFRSPGFRFDIPGTKIDGVLRHWIRTWGHFGKKLD